MPEKAQSATPKAAQPLIPQESLRINAIPAVVYGNEAAGVYLFLHGKCGCKEEAGDFARTVCLNGWQVLGIDLPGHGERKGEDGFDPWHVVPELRAVMDFLRRRWTRVRLRANSIGAWFAMLSFAEQPPEKCLFVSPILNMERLIADMMGWAGVSEAELREKREIATPFGETLSWRYLEFARQNPVTQWSAPTCILYAGRDNLTSRETVDAFAAQFRCRLAVMAEGEHWFHTPEQLAVLHQWEEENQ